MGRVVSGRTFSIKIFAKINMQIIKNEFSIPDHSSRLTATSATDQQGAGGNYSTARCSIVLISRNIFLVSDSPRAALHDPQFKIMLMIFWFTCDVTVTGLLYSFSSSTPHLEGVYAPRTNVTTFTIKNSSKAFCF